jgi:hypothetical protein
LNGFSGLLRADGGALWDEVSEIKVYEVALFIVPFRYGARSLKAIEFTATSFAPPKPWPT